MTHPDLPPLSDVILRLARVCERSGVPYAVGGAVAATFWGVPRIRTCEGSSGFRRTGSIWPIFARGAPVRWTTRRQPSSSDSSLRPGWPDARNTPPCPDFGHCPGLGSSFGAGTTFSNGRTQTERN